MTTTPINTENTTVITDTAIDKDLYTYQTEKGKCVAPVIDIQAGLNMTLSSLPRIKKEMRILKEIGFTRVYFVLCNSNYAMLTYPRWSDSEKAYITGQDYIKQSLSSLKCDPNQAYIDACKEAGMEAFVIYKPYEGGGVKTVPEGATAKSSNAHIPTVGGLSINTDAFIAQNPDLRVQRKPDANVHDDMPVTKIEIAFILDSYYSNSNVRSAGVKESNVRSAAQNYKLWVSGNNSDYKLYSGNTTVNFRTEKRDTYDMSGVKIGYNYVVMSIEGINIPYDYKYTAVTFDDATSLHTIPYSSIALYNGNTLLSSTSTQFVRVPANADDTPQNHEWGNEASKPAAGCELSGITVDSQGNTTGIVKTSNNKAENFNKWGFEFGWIYDSQYALWSNSPVYGISRGTIEYIPGALCEAYPEVREYWLSQIKLALDYGADGVDIRPQSHSSMAVDYQNYGFNEPIAEKYKELYNVDIYKEQADFLKLAEIRGDFFLEFIRKAAELTHSYDAVFQVHLTESYTSPNLSTKTFQVGHWTDPKIILDWKACVDVADEITIKDNIYSTYRNTLAKEIREYAKQNGKAVWMNAYLQQGNTDNAAYIAAADKDENTTGILLYELTFDAGFSTDLITGIKNILSDLGSSRVSADS